MGRKWLFWFFSFFRKLYLPFIKTNSVLKNGTVFLGKIPVVPVSFFLCGPWTPYEQSIIVILGTGPYVGSIVRRIRRGLENIWCLFFSICKVILRQNKPLDISYQSINRHIPICKTSFIIAVIRFEYFASETRINSAKTYTGNFLSKFETSFFSKLLVIFHPSMSELTILIK